MLQRHSVRPYSTAAVHIRRRTNHVVRLKLDNRRCAATVTDFGCWGCKRRRTHSDKGEMKGSRGAAPTHNAPIKRPRLPFHAAPSFSTATSVVGALITSYTISPAIVMKSTGADGSAGIFSRTHCPRLLPSGVARGCGPHRAALARGGRRAKIVFKKNSRENSDCKFRTCLRAARTYRPHGRL